MKRLPWLRLINDSTVKCKTNVKFVSEKVTGDVSDLICRYSIIRNFIASPLTNLQNVYKVSVVMSILIKCYRVAYTIEIASNKFRDRNFHEWLVFNWESGVRVAV